MGLPVPDDLVHHLPLCLTACCLVTFECVEWHAANRVKRQFGLTHSIPGPPFFLGNNHCRRLSSHQYHDWRSKNDHWVAMWEQKRFFFVVQEDNIDETNPDTNYDAWYTRFASEWLTLSDKAWAPQQGEQQPHPPPLPVHEHVHKEPQHPSHPQYPPQPLYPPQPHYPPDYPPYYLQYYPTHYPPQYPPQYLIRSDLGKCTESYK
ncbi:hypothetical protein PIB30_064421 [Stylosanthes scabra]|uniref:Aminotransferase-like plant mobile domain-containing protein n=1 Tax=Stylosanthes scabra TaxID=79078 RepID=A0ABU6YPB3_9FABA|nr:hypothetical protein [Stylosanthes scabra]